MQNWVWVKARRRILCLKHGFVLELLMSAYVRIQRSVRLEAPAFGHGFFLDLPLYNLETVLSRFVRFDAPEFETRVHP